MECSQAPAADAGAITHITASSRNVQSIPSSSAMPDIASSHSTAEGSHQVGLTPTAVAQPWMLVRPASLSAPVQSKERKHQQKHAPSSNAMQFFLTALVAAGGFALANWLVKRAGAKPGSPKSSKVSESTGKLKKPVKQKQAGTKSKRSADQRQHADQAGQEQEQAQQAPPPEPVEPDAFELFCSAVTLTPAPPGDGPSPPQSLAGLRLAVSEDLGVAGAATSYGTPYAVVEDAASSSTYGAVTRLVGAGATVIGKTSMQPLGVDLLGTNFGNPYNKAKMSGGGQTGEGVSVKHMFEYRPGQCSYTVVLQICQGLPAACLPC